MTGTKRFKVGVAVAVLIGWVALATPPQPASAGVGASAAPEFPAETRLGDVGIPASIEIRNANSDDPDPAAADQDTGFTNTVCNEGDAVPCPPGGRGITLVPSCGLIGAAVTCDPTGLEPGVIVLSPTANGSGACAGLKFDVRLIDPLSGMYQFVPTVGNVELPGTGARCAIGFTFDVIGLPAIDLDPLVAGIQSAQIVSSDQIVDEASGNSMVPASGDGTSVHTILRAETKLESTASAVVTVGGGELFDTAMITGRYTPDESAAVDFRLYGPDDPTCTDAPVFESLGIPQPAADGPIVSGSFAPAWAGTYRWVATYSGDTFNAPVTGVCGDPRETVEVARAAADLSTRASHDTLIDVEPLVDTATVSGRVNPQASTIDFRLFGPDDTRCAGEPVFSSLGIPYPVDGGVVRSASFEPTEVGSYRWVASYSGDVNNAPVTGSCSDPAEQTIVSGGSPTLEATASADIKLGAGDLFDVAELSGLVAGGAGGTVDFVLFGPGDATCSATPVFESLKVPIGRVSTLSTSFTPRHTGVYRWIASFSGDSKNAPVGGVCGLREQSVAVMPAMPSVAIAASPLIFLGEGTLSATTDVTSRMNPDGSGAIDFRLFAPDDPDCAGTPIYVSPPIPYPVGGGSLSSPEFTPSFAGDYTWQVTYGGDANNTEMSSSCSDPAAIVTVIDADDTVLPNTGRTSHRLALVGIMLILVGSACSMTARRGVRVR